MALGELSALADAVCWAGTGVTTKRLGRAIRPVHVSAFLATVSTLALLVISAATGQLDDIARTPASSIGLFALGAALGAAGMLMFFITISMGSVGAAYTATSGLYILFSLIGGVLFLGDRAGVWTIIGAAAILAGLYLFNSRPAADQPPIDLSQGGERAGEASAAGGPRRFLPFLGERMPQRRSRPPVTGRASAGAWGMTGGAATAAFGLATVTAVLWAIDLLASKKGLEEAGLLANGLVHQAVPALLFGGFVAASAKTRRIHIGPGDRLRLGMAGVLYVGSTLSWNYALANADAGVTALLASTSPVFALILAGVLLRERLSRTAVIGAVLAFTGIVAVIASR